MAKKAIKLTDEQLTVIAAFRPMTLEVQLNSMTSDRHAKAIRKILANENLSEGAKVKVNDFLDAIEESASADTYVARTFEGRYCGIDKEHLFGGVNFYDGMMYATGDAFKYNATTSDSLPEEVLRRYDEMFDFVSANLLDIEEIIHQFAAKGGIKAGVTYTCLDNEGLWKVAD